VILFIRHGPTDWNVRGLIQGRSDVPLSAEGRAEVARWRLRPEFHGWRWYVSPLRRAAETAALLGARDYRLEPRLMEAHWGRWEGQSLEQLRSELGDVFAAMARRGLDLLPPDGESPRMVCGRLSHWLAEVATNSTPIVAVSHAGILRAAYSLATGWEMRDKAPLARAHGFAHLYGLSADGRLTVRELNIALQPSGIPVDAGTP
jgi:probable phosphoglycerate mutase